MIDRLVRRHVNTGPFLGRRSLGEGGPFGYQSKRLVRGGGDARRRHRRSRRAALEARAAAEVMLAVAVVAGDANRPPCAVHDDDRMEAIGLARATVILERLPGPERAIHAPYCVTALTLGATCNFPAASGF